MASSLNQRRKGPRITADVLAGGLWTWILFRVGEGGLNPWWEWPIFFVCCLFIGTNMKDIADAVTEPRATGGAS